MRIAPAIELSFKQRAALEQIQRVVEMTTRHKPPHATHWSTRTIAAAVGISEASVRRIWHTHGLKPHLLQTFKVSRSRFSLSILIAPSSALITGSLMPSVIGDRPSHPI